MKASIEAQQTVRPADYVVQPAGAKYKAHKWKELWWGKHYRNEWTAPVSFPYLDWEKTKGGLTPLKIGGGHETKTLRVLSTDDKEYVLRTMDKDLTVKVPEELRGTYANDVANDQISTAHPYGPIVIARLAAAAGLLHTNPVFYYVPANNKDTAFNNTFAGKLCLLEERPSGKGWKGTVLTNYAEKVVNTADMLASVNADSRYQVDQKAFLKVRLFDMWINDWDRHDDQWVWCAHTVGDKVVYTPFGRDRDQAFSKTDGINLYFLSRPWAFRSLQNFTNNVKDVIGANLSALSLDRQFLNALSREDWKSVAEELQQALTDNVIHEALNVLPDTIAKLSGSYIKEKLMQRRSHLLHDALDYYSFLSKQVDIVGTAQRDAFVIDNKSSDETSITVRRIIAEGELGDTVYRRIFFDSETNRLTLYGLEGDDLFFSTGLVKSRMRVNALGGAGVDHYLSSNTQKGSGKKTAVYEFDNNPGYYEFIFNNHENSDSVYRNYNRSAFKPNWHRIGILPGYNSDDGFTLAGTYTYRKYGWMKTPYAWQQSLTLNHSFGSHGWLAEYRGNFAQVIGKAGAEIAMSYQSADNLFSYFGKGNETRLSSRDNDYYFVKGQAYTAEPSLTYAGKNSLYKFGLIYRYVRLDSFQNQFINTQHGELDANLFSSLNWGGLRGSYAYTKTDAPLYPTKGFKATADIQWLQRFASKGDGLLKGSAAVCAYLPVGAFVVAHRTGSSAINRDDFPFFLAPTLDGKSNLRGYWQNRFYGKTALYQNTELRIKVRQANGYVLRGALGLLAFFDDGRVWVPGENSTKWHTGYGGGLFFIPYNLVAFTCTYGVSNEVRTFQLKAGFFF